MINHKRWFSLRIRRLRGQGFIRFQHLLRSTCASVKSGSGSTPRSSGTNRGRVAAFPRKLAAVVNSLQLGYRDCLGQVFMALDLGGQWRGQFFTPYEVCRLLAALNLPGRGRRWSEAGLLHPVEPPAARPALVIACADEARAQGLDPQRCMHTSRPLTSTHTAVHMALASARSVPSTCRGSPRQRTDAGGVGGTGSRPRMCWGAGTARLR